jgi:hypothetical protein
MKYNILVKYIGSMGEIRSVHTILIEGPEWES